MLPRPRLRICLLLSQSATPPRDGVQYGQRPDESFEHETLIVSRALDGASLVFMFSTRFGVVEDDGEGEGEGGAVLKVSSHVRRHVEAGTLIVTVNNVLSEADGFRLVRRVEGPDSERTGGSEAYIWEAVA